MPNWTSNDLTIEAANDNDAQQLELFVFAVRRDGEANPENEDGNLSLLRTFLPIDPPDYNKQVETWGTKWYDGAREQWVADDCMTANYAMETAWCPPIDGIRRIAAMFPKLLFRLSYWEPGMAFAGAFFIRGDQEEEWNFDYPDFMEDLPDGMDDESDEAMDLYSEREMEWISDIEDKASKHIPTFDLPDNVININVNTNKGVS
jgi:hypothetical protein